MLISHSLKTRSYGLCQTNGLCLCIVPSPCCRFDLFVEDVLAAKLGSDSLAGQMQDMYQHLVATGHLRAADRKLLAAWLFDLQTAGYSMPVLTSSAPLQNASTAMSLGTTLHDASGVSQYTAAKQQPTQQTFAFMRRWCMHYDKVLYININHFAGYNAPELARLLFAAYRPLFRGVVFAATLAKVRKRRCQVYFTHVMGIFQGPANMGFGPGLTCAWPAFWPQTPGKR